MNLSSDSPFFLLTVRSSSIHHHLLCGGARKSRPKSTVAADAPPLLFCSSVLRDRPLERKPVSRFWPSTCIMCCSRAVNPPAQPAFILRGHSAQLHAVHFTPRNRRLLTGDADGWVISWNLSFKRPVAVWKAHAKTLLGLGSWAEDRVITWVLASHQVSAREVD